MTPLKLKKIFGFNFYNFLKCWLVYKKSQFLIFWSFSVAKATLEQLMSVCPSICLSVSMSVSPSVHLSVRQSVHQYVRQSVHQSVRQSVCPSVSPSVSLSVSPSISPSVSLSITIRKYKNYSNSVKYLNMNTNSVNNCNIGILGKPSKKK